MANPGQPTVALGATGDVVRRLQRAWRRTPNLGLVVDDDFGPATDHAVREFQPLPRYLRAENVPLPFPG